MKFLLEYSNGRQEIRDVPDEAMFETTATVLWDERKEGRMPAVELGGAVKQGKNLVLDSAKLKKHQDDRKAEHEAEAKKSADRDAVFERLKKAKPNGATPEELGAILADVLVAMGVQ